MTDVLDKPQFKVVGTRPIRPDGVDKVTGRAQYGADLVLARPVDRGKVKRSPHAHARIVAIDAKKALALPGVKAVVTAADFPDLASQEIEGGEAGGNLRDLSHNVIARHKVLLRGPRPEAAVAATRLPSIADRGAGPDRGRVRGAAARGRDRGRHGGRTRARPAPTDLFTKAACRQARDQAHPQRGRGKPLPNARAATSASASPRRT